MKNNKRQTPHISSMADVAPKRAGTILACLYFAGVAVRFILGLFFRHGSTILIDETLYINIAKSLALEGEIAFRSQPVPYLNIFYPLLLVPIYLIKFPFDLYRVIQLYNGFLMASAIFPVYLFAKDFTGSRKKGLLGAVITLLMPDMIMSAFLMTECVIWPLSMWLIFFAYRLYTIDEGKIRNAVLTGVFTALLFWTKPGSMAAGAVLLLIAIIAAIVRKEDSLLKAGLIGTGTAVALIALFYVLYVAVFGYDMSVLGLYDKQLTDVSLKWILAVPEFSLLQILLLAIASCGVFAIAPYALISEYSEKQRRFIFAAAAGIAASAVGTAALVDTYGWNGSFTNMQLHLRYLAMFVPVLFVFCLQIPDKKGKVGKKLIVPLAITAVLSVIPGARVGSVYGESTCIDSIALSAFMRTSHLSSVSGAVLTIALAVFLVFVIMDLSSGISAGLKKLCAVFFVLFALFNNFAAYHITNDISVDPVFAADGVEMNALIEAEEGPVLAITPKHYNDLYTALLETRIRKPMQHVTSENILAEAVETGGVYVPFVPVDQSPNRQNHISTDTGTFLLGKTIAEHLELSDTVTSETTANGLYTLVHSQKGELWADSMLYGLDRDVLSTSQDAHLFIFDDSRFSDGQTVLRLYARAGREGTVLRVTNNSAVTEFPLSAQEAEYSLEISPGSTSLSADGGEIILRTYTTGK